MRRGRRYLVVALAALVLVAGCSGSDPGRSSQSPAAQHPDQFVRAENGSFTVDGQAFRFIGANLYDAAATDRYSCNPGTRLGGTALQDAFRTLRTKAGVTVIRFWAYQTYTAGATDFTGVDRVIAAAKAEGMRVLPVLEDGPGDCTTGPVGESKAEADNGQWFSQGYRRPYGTATLSLRDYAAAMATHYAGEPTILGWSLMNEAETTERTPDGASSLVPFAEDVAQVVHTADPNHLVTLGTQSNGAPGASGTDFTAVYSLPALDFAEVHDWASYGADDEAIPGGDGPRPPAADAGECTRTDSRIGCSFALAPALGKPLLVGEAGIQGRDAQARDVRAQQLGDKIAADFAAGASGWMVWSVTTAITDGYDLVLGQDDPLYGVMLAASRDLAATG